MKFTRKRIRIITERPLEVLFPAIRSLAREDEQGRGGRPKSGDVGRRRREGRGQGARGDHGASVEGFGWGGGKVLNSRL